MAPDDTFNDEEPVDTAFLSTINMMTSKLRQLHLRPRTAVLVEGPAIGKRITTEETFEQGSKRQKTNRMEVDPVEVSIFKDQLESLAPIKKTIHPRITFRAPKSPEFPRPSPVPQSSHLDDNNNYENAHEIVDFEYIGMPLTRPKPVQKARMSGAEKNLTTGRAIARFRRYCYSRYHKYVTVALECPWGCHEQRLFTVKAELDRHLAVDHDVWPKECPNAGQNTPWYARFRFLFGKR